jgi:anaerobic glycerol-3-phosphate dehydrogenase
MPRYRVTLRRTSVEIVEASNPYQAAIVASQLGGDGVEVETVAPAVGRPVVSSVRKTAKAAKKVAKKRRPLSPEARAKLAQNLVKARAARAAKAKAKAAKKSSRKPAAKKTKGAAKKR